MLKDFELNRRRKFGLIITVFVLLLILLLNVYDNMTAPLDRSDFDLMMQHLDWIWLLMVIILALINGIFFFAGLVALIMRRNEMAASAFTAFLYSLIVFISATWATIPSAFLILPIICLAAAVTFHFFKKFRYRDECLIILAIAILTTLVYRAYYWIQ